MSLVDLGKRLLEAAKQGLTEEVRTLMSNGAPFTTDWLGTSPLHYAALNGHVGTAEVLLRAGISRDARTKVDRTPLHVASQEGHMEVVDLLIKNGADIEAKDMLKMTPLHWAVEHGHVAVIELLLGHGSDINIDNKFNKSPIDIAINNGRADVAELLQLARMPQQNIVEVTTDQTLVEEVTDSAHLEIHEEAVHHTDELGGGVDQSSTAVLATLAALAEATGPLSTNTSNSSAVEALSWLESHGITMISGDQQTTLVDSGGQSLSLTEAGKLALDSLVKQQKVLGLPGDVDGEITDENGQPMVIRLTSDGQAIAMGNGDHQGVLKRIKLEDNTEVLTTEDGTITSLPPGYVLAKTEPHEVGVIEGETLVEETVEGELLVGGDGLVTCESVTIQDGMSPITIQTDMQHHHIAQDMGDEMVDMNDFTVVHHEDQLESSQHFQNQLDDITSKT